MCERDGYFCGSSQGGNKRGIVSGDVDSAIEGEMAVNAEA